MDFSEKNFVDTCQISDVGTSTIVECYSSAGSLDQILLISFLVIVVMVVAIKLLNSRK